MKAHILMPAAAMAHVWQSEGSFVDSVFFFCLSMGSGDLIQTIRVHDKGFYPSVISPAPSFSYHRLVSSLSGSKSIPMYVPIKNEPDPFFSFSFSLSRNLLVFPGHNI